MGLPADLCSPGWPGGGVGLSCRDPQRMSRQAQLSREQLWGMGSKAPSCLPFQDSHFLLKRRFCRLLAPRASKSFVSLVVLARAWWFCPSCGQEQFLTRVPFKGPGSLVFPLAVSQLWPWSGFLPSPPAIQCAETIHKEEVGGERML